ncbi:MAG: hypothetical protein A2945_02340 [Candidatus Liptonbacteria bacterium RIFCSPLOWO2_01_FULL_52_25]|uniref:Uncharacterized protein n=1 Tax=Candidatus Liptonbacteria bacterium RIFCSPLOWO2_01_FULL_52_25 TaxID=1798650 RepID=A0A1G2CEI7_9BACT|nr:MAG: hypothetical protein A2945_02340 [Candidatus Liptonbacteria bacterium RIFCSPLOWO2_01_FULL_52_25]
MSDSVEEGLKMKKGRKKKKLNINKIAKGLGAERRGKVSNKGGYFGALQTTEEVMALKDQPRKARGRKRN